MVGEDERGDKTVDSSMLPLLLLQPVKELGHRDDDLAQRNEELRGRLDALEALVGGLVSGGVAEP